MSTEPIEILAHKSHVNAVAFSPDGKFLVTAGMDNLVKLWTVEEWSLFSTFFGHRKSVNSLSFTPDGAHLLTSSTDRTVREWTFPFGSEERSRERLASAVVAPDGETVASLDGKKRIRLWSRASEETRALLDHDSRVTAHRFSPDGGELLAAPAGEPVVRWTVESGEEAGRFPADDTAVAAMRWIDGEDRLAVSGYEGTVVLVETGSWDVVERIDLDADDGTFPLAVSPDGEELAVGTAHRVRTYDTDDGALRADVEVDPKGVYSLAYDPEGRWLAVGAADKRVRIWER